MQRRRQHIARRWLCSHTPSTRPKLRPYQFDCVETVLDAFQNRQRVAVTLPVGSGKTVIFSEIIGRMPNPSNGANRTLVLAHRQELLEQARSKIENAFPTLRVATEQVSLFFNCPVFLFPFFEQQSEILAKVILLFSFITCCCCCCCCCCQIKLPYFRLLN
jgi:hypothetical protein